MTANMELEWSLVQSMKTPHHIDIVRPPRVTWPLGVTWTD